MVQEAARKLNFFPVKHGILNVFSPYAIVIKKNLDYKTQCAAPILSAVLAHDEPIPSNTMATRAIEAVYICPAGQSGHLFYNVENDTLFTRRKFTEVAITPAFIKKVEAWAEKNDISSLKIENKKGVTIYDSTVIAGVDHDEIDKIEESDNEEEEYQDEINPNENYEEAVPEKTTEEGEGE